MACEPFPITLWRRVCTMECISPSKTSRRKEEEPGEDSFAMMIPTAPKEPIEQTSTLSWLRFSSWEWEHERLDRRHLGTGQAELGLVDEAAGFMVPPAAEARVVNGLLGA